MDRKKQKKRYLFLLLMAFAVAAGILYYSYDHWRETPENLQRGVLVHEQYVIYSDRQKS